MGYGIVGDRPPSLAVVLQYDIMSDSPTKSPPVQVEIPNIFLPDQEDPKVNIINKIKIYIFISNPEGRLCRQNGFNYTLC